MAYFGVLLFFNGLDHLVDLGNFLIVYHSNAALVLTQKHFDFFILLFFLTTERSLRKALPLSLLDNRLVFLLSSLSFGWRLAYRAATTFLRQLGFTSRQQLSVYRLGAPVIRKHTWVERIQDKATIGLRMVKILECGHLAKAEDLLVVLSLVARLLTLNLEGLHDVLASLLAHLELHLFLSLRNEDDDLSRPLAACAPEALDHAYRRGKAIVAYDQVDVADVETLLCHASSDQCVDLAVLETLDHGCLDLLCEPSIVLSDEDLSSNDSLVLGIQKTLNLMSRFSERREDNGL